MSNKINEENLNEVLDSILEEDAGDMENKEEAKKEVLEEINEFHLDPSNPADRKRITESYKKTLRKQIFAPLVGSGPSKNPIDLIKEEEEEKRKRASGTLDIFDLTDKRIKAMEKRVAQAETLSRVALAIAIVATLAVVFLTSSLK